MFCLLEYNIEQLRVTLITKSEIPSTKSGPYCKVPAVDQVIHIGGSGLLVKYRTSPLSIMATNVNLGQSVWNAYDDLINPVAIIFCSD